MTKMPLQILGLKCWKCGARAGDLCIPVDSEFTPEFLGKLLFYYRIVPLCNKCEDDNPMRISYEQAQKDI